VFCGETTFYFKWKPTCFPVSCYADTTILKEGPWIYLRIPKIRIEIYSLLKEIMGRACLEDTVYILNQKVKIYKFYYSRISWYWLR